MRRFELLIFVRFCCCCCICLAVHIGDGGVASMWLRIQGVGMVVKCSNLVTGLDFFLFTSLFRLKINVLYYMASSPRGQDGSNSVL